VSDYQFDTDQAGNTITDITGLHVKMTGDTRYTPLDRLTLSDAAAQLIMSPPDTTVTGTPTGYLEKGNVIFLDTIPETDGTGKLFYRLVPSYFVASDTTKTPGFIDAGHPSLSIGASIDWLSVNKDENITLINRATAELAKVDELLDDYTRQKNPTRSGMTGAVHSSR
jgi:hypothetical protein